MEEDTILVLDVEFFKTIPNDFWGFLLEALFENFGIPSSFSSVFIDIWEVDKEAHIPTICSSISEGIKAMVNMFSLIPSIVFGEKTPNILFGLQALCEC